MFSIRARAVAALLLTGGLFVLPVLAAENASIESEIELLRSDLKTDKVEIIKKALPNLEAAKADAFWPVYRKYQYDLDKIGDKRVAVIKDFATNYDRMTDDKAKSLVKQSLDIQTERTELLKKYYKDFSKVLGATDAAKLVQVENLINSLIDVQLAANLPLVEKPAAATTK